MRHLIRRLRFRIGIRRGIIPGRIIDVGVVLGAGRLDRAGDRAIITVIGASYQAQRSARQKGKIEIRFHYPPKCNGRASRWRLVIWNELRATK